jgi:hypothetical protein
MSSSSTFRIRHATGFRSLANASQPTRNASSGIEPPPAKGSTTSGGPSGYAARTSPRATSRKAGLAELSQLLKSAMNPKRDRLRASSLSPTPRTRPTRRRASRLNSLGHSGSHGSGSNSPINTARHAASGRRAHQRSSVFGCPLSVGLLPPPAATPRPRGSPPQPAVDNPPGSLPTPMILAAHRTTPSASSTARRCSSSPTGSLRPGYRASEA